MRTIAIIVAGLVIFGVFALVGSRFGNGAQSIVSAAKIFIPVWLLGALINMWMGVSRAGYPVTEEFPIFLLIFIVPAVVAASTWWKYS